MKKLLIGLLLVGLACGALADSYTYSVTLAEGATNTATVLPISGYLDRVVISQTTSATSTVVIAEYSGTTAVENYVTTGADTGNQVVRPRFIGTGNDGTALAGANSLVGGVLTSSGTNALGIVTGYTYSNPVPTTVLSPVYEKAIIGGNCKISVINNDITRTNTVRAVVFFEPLPR